MSTEDPDLYEKYEDNATNSMKKKVKLQVLHVLILVTPTKNMQM